MSSIKIDNFAGISPRYSARLLPQNGATQAANAKLLSGELRGLHEAQLIKDFNPLSPPNPVTRAFRIPSVLANPTPMQSSDNWIYFMDPNVDFIRTPVLEDQFERHYWTGDSFGYNAPTYNTLARILAGNTGSSAPFLLGVPTPVNAPTVTPAAGSDETRAYVYTFVSAYGEEGPPSPPTQGTGADTGSWTIAGFDTSVPNPTERNITTVRIYRTVAGATDSEFFFVADLALGTTTYNDSAVDATIANNTAMPSLTWTQPPSTLLGVQSHPGGFLVGFSGRDLWMSVPYQPHAWPVQQIQTCDTEIVGVAIFGNVIVVCTTSHLYYAEGMDPLNITLQKLQSVDPCVSRRSIATTLNGVYYSSTQGIVYFDGTRAQLSTYPLFTREEWQDFFSATTVYAVPYGVQYIAFDTTSTGFIFSPGELGMAYVSQMTSPAGSAGHMAPLTTLDRFSNVTAIQVDPYTGDVYLISKNQVLLWDPPASIPYEYTWVSKEFDLPNPVNFGAMRVKFAANPIQISASQVTAYTEFNTQRIQSPLNCFNLQALNGVRTVPAFTGAPGSITGYEGPQIRCPIGGSPLFPINALTNVIPRVQVNVYARDLDSEWDQVFSWTVTNERILRMPAGFKSDGWQIELIGNVAVYSIALAETATELKKL